MNWTVYQEGYDRCTEVKNNVSKAVNPYYWGSDEWRSWNHGWNANYEFEKLQEEKK